MTQSMRVIVAALLVLASLAGGRSPAFALASTSLDLSSDRVDFFSNRFVVTADGNVRVRLSDGTIVRGDTFTMDLKLNRYLIAGDVHLDGPTVHESGAAFAGYPDLDRSYFLPAPGTPERWTYFGQNFTDKHIGRQQPGDAFYFPDLTGERPYIIATGVRIVPKTNALFDNARIYTAGAYVPSPRYVVTFSSNSHFFENGFPGGRFDVGVPFNGSAHSLTALHLRNDAVNGTYTAFDQHFVWNNDWVVASIDPLTQEQRQYNLIGYKRFSPAMDGRLFVQESAAQAGIINRPENASAFGQLQMTAGMGTSSFSLTLDNYYQQLLGFAKPPNDAAFTCCYDPRWREHPSDGLMTFTTGEIFKYRPVVVRLRSGLGEAHDAYGEGGYPNQQPGPPTSWYHFGGISVYTAPIRLKGGYSFIATYDKQRTWYSTPHQVDLATTRGTLSRTFPLQHVNAFVAYQTATTGDFWGARQLEAYPTAPDTIVNEFGTFHGQDAFHGFATSRSLTGSVVYTPTQYFNLTTTLARFVDFPKPVPGLFGQPPLQLTTDLRLRVSKQLLMDITRSYYFNFANERWSPQLGIQFSP